MATTQEQVIRELIESGRLADDWPRRLTNWRAIGLLPPLTGCSLGRTGWIYWWDEPDIIDRAKTVHDLLAGNRDADAALISLALMGFAVCPKKFREAWLRSLEKRKAQFQRLVDRHGDEDAASAALGAIHARAVARRLGTRWSTAIKLAEEMSALIFVDNPDTTSAEAVFRDMALQFATRMIGRSDVIEQISLERTKQVLNRFSSISTNSVTAETIFGSTSDEMARVLRQCVPICRAITQLMPDLPLPSGTMNADKEYIINIGRYIFPALLLGYRRGHAEQITQSVRLLESAMENYAFRGLIRQYAATGNVNEEGLGILLSLLLRISGIWAMPDLISRLATPIPDGTKP